MKQIIEYVGSFLTIALLLAGIGGVAYHMFKEGGWVGTILGTFVDFQMGNPVIAVPVTLAVLFLGKLWFDNNRAKGHTSQLPNIVVYAIMAAGAYFIWQFLMD